MKNTVKILQGISRILLLVVGLALISGSLFFTGVHMANKNVTKTETQGVIVRGDEALKEVNYTFEGVSHQVRPLDTYFRNLGTVDTKIKIYVDNEHPERIFLTYRGDGLMRTAGILAGWGLLLLVILLGERQLMSRMKKLEQLAEEEEKETLS
ncbi:MULTISPECIES: hypothetical protein [Lactococcus]|uniref:DUF3592 domain-containing protein n=2 Tax=Lactococcus TaxID=1357 RepID=A0AAJ2IXJ6_9LACT|nr:MULTISPECIES: hypothetical protein [Lactococcus]MBD5824303.1 hypothetical protein [Lactococcus petauri]MCH1712144.1 hypothetical protein [Lactococcus petauri]MCI3871820.1 hypothetical protein [Lactococcus petauri]MCQ8275654.1 hypothetical protein [Lactococcus petauri]MCR6589753.1 hypothetical protein [Lactococcus petauri]